MNEGEFRNKDDLNKNKGYLKYEDIKCEDELKYEKDLKYENDLKQIKLNQIFKSKPIESN